MVTPRRGASSTPSSSSFSSAPVDQPPPKMASRTPPFLPTYLERIALALFPSLLVFGTLFAVINPQTRSAVYDHVAQAYSQDPNFTPNYFARKSNLFNVFFVKKGWAWTTAAFAAFVFTHPSLGYSGAITNRKARAALRWIAVTTWWVLVTQWCFGPAIIDRGFRWTGGKCEAAVREIELSDKGEVDLGDLFTGVACKAAGGKWKGGHDISGHVFLLVLGTAFLMQEVGWPLVKSMGWNAEERTVVMGDGAWKSAAVEDETRATNTTATKETEQERQKPQEKTLGWGVRFSLAVMALNLWMLLMTAIYFHTWFEKLTGLLTALVGYYAVYMVPRHVIGIRQVLGLPGI